MAEPISSATWSAVMHIADRYGVPRSIAHRQMIEESGDPLTGTLGDAKAVSDATPEGYHSLGLYQLYARPDNLAWLIAEHWTPRHPGEVFDIFNPRHNAEVAMAYLARLHSRFGSWERALWYYNAGRVTDVPEKTLGYARRIIEAPAP